MRTHDEEHASPEPRPAAPRRADVETAVLVSRALEDGRPERLDTHGVEYLQRSAGNEAVAQLLGASGEEEASPVAGVVGSGGGAPMSEAVREKMESHFGADFSGVRIHTGTRADTSARSLHAQAYTVGSDIAFRDGAYAPDSDDGQRMLAHELTHVVQQRSGPVDGTAMPGGVKVSHPSDRFEVEAEHSADAFMSAHAGPAPAPAAAEAAPSTSLSAQRAESGDEPQEEIQGMFVQRKGDQENEEGEEWPNG